MWRSSLWPNNWSFRAFYHKASYTRVYFLKRSNVLQSVTVAWSCIHGSRSWTLAPRTMIDAPPASCCWCEPHWFLWSLRRSKPFSMQLRVNGLFSRQWQSGFIFSHFYLNAQVGANLRICTYSGKAAADIPQMYDPTFLALSSLNFEIVMSQTSKCSPWHEVGASFSLTHYKNWLCPEWSTMK